jgi:hypothetical protein
MTGYGVARWKGHFVDVRAKRERSTSREVKVKVFLFCFSPLSQVGLVELYEYGTYREIVQLAQFPKSLGRFTFWGVGGVDWGRQLRCEKYLGDGDAFMLEEGENLEKGCSAGAP